MSTTILATNRQTNPRADTERRIIETFRARQPWRDSPLTVTQLAERLGKREVTIRQVLERLVRYGYVTRGKIQGRGGPRGYSLTEKGAAFGELMAGGPTS